MKLNVPINLTAGDAIYWDSDLGDDYPSDSYTLSWVFYNGQTSLNLTAVPQDLVYRTTITSVQSTALVPGTYYWQAYITEDVSGDRLTIGSGALI